VRLLAILQMLLADMSTAARETQSTLRPPVTVSVGAVSVVPGRDDLPSDALGTADGLLYEAKSGGRARAVHLDVSTSEKTIVVMPAIAAQTR
jgi:PleD family two-component response regulator